MDIRDWQRSDLAAVGKLWLEAYDNLELTQMPLHPQAADRLRGWLIDRLRDRQGLGYIAEVEGELAGFLIGRVGSWESDPPILSPRRMGLIDVVYVAASHRRKGLGSALIRYALQDMESRDVVRIETNFEMGDTAASGLWQKAGFVPWIARAYRSGPILSRT